MLVLLVLLTAGGSGLAGWYFYARRHTARPDLILHPIKKEKLQITITERGSLEPADNTFFTCKVKAKNPGQPSTSIRWVIDNGSIVKKGEKIMELDDSALQDQKTAQEIEVYKAEEAWQKAELQKIINLRTNETDVAKQKTALEVAKINLEEYQNGVYVQERLDLENKFTMARSDLFMWEERAKWSEMMSRPGRQYVTVSQAESDESRRKTAELTVKNYEKQLWVKDNLTKKKNEVTFQGQIDDAKNQLKAFQDKLEQQLKSDEVAVKSAYAQYQKQLSRLNEIQTEIDDCLIRAPRDGMVVYYVEERARFGQNQGVIAQGEQVKEGQKLIAVPDMRHMVVNARVHEAMVDKVAKGADDIKYTGFSEAVNTALLFSPQPLSALSAYVAFDTDLQTPFSNNHEDLEKELKRRGLEAIVRVNAFPDRPLKAHVKSVAPVASQTDFFSSDVKVYQTYIAIDDDNLDGLKPGMDAVCTIFVDSLPEPVLTIPLGALLGGVEMADKRRCFVLVDGHPEMREITVGKNNEMVAEVKDGLKEGDVVVLNPSMLLSDKEKAQYGVSSAPSRSGGGRGEPGAGPSGGKGGRGGKGGWPGKGKGGGPGMQGGPGMPGGGFGGGGPRSQGGAPSGGKRPANP